MISVVIDQFFGVFGLSRIQRIKQKFYQLTKIPEANVVVYNQCQYLKSFCLKHVDDFALKSISTKTVLQQKRTIYFEIDVASEAKKVLKFLGLPQLRLRHETQK